MEKNIESLSDRQNETDQKKKKNLVATEVRLLMTAIFIQTE